MATAKKKTKTEETKSKTGIIHRLWLTVAAIIVLVTGYVIIRNVIVIADYRIKISRLQREKAEYQKSIQADSLLIEQLKHDDYLEKFARERYRMQRADEQVFITK